MSALLVAKIAPVGMTALSLGTGMTGAYLGVWATGIGPAHAASKIALLSAVITLIVFITHLPGLAHYRLLFKNFSMPSAAEIALELIS